MKGFIIPVFLFSLAIIAFVCIKHASDRQSVIWETRKQELLRQGLTIVSENEPSLGSKGTILTKKDGRFTLWIYTGDFCKLTGVQSEGGNITGQTGQ